MHWDRTFWFEIRHSSPTQSLISCSFVFFFLSSSQCFDVKQMMGGFCSSVISLLFVTQVEGIIRCFCIVAAENCYLWKTAFGISLSVETEELIVSAAARWICSLRIRKTPVWEEVSLQLFHFSNVRSWNDQHVFIFTIACIQYIYMYM